MSCKKKCPQCACRLTKKHGKRNRKQRYKCKQCGHVFTISKTNNNNWIDQAYKDYVKGKQTLSQLSSKYKKCERTIQTYFDEYNPLTGEI